MLKNVMPKYLFIWKNDVLVIPNIPNILKFLHFINKDKKYSLYFIFLMLSLHLGYKPWREQRFNSHGFLQDVFFFFFPTKPFMDQFVQNCGCGYNIYSSCPPLNYSWNKTKVIF